MIKDNLVLIFWLTFLAFFILTFQRLYIHSNHISIIQLLFVCFHFILPSKISFLLVHLLYYSNISSSHRCCLCQTSHSLSRSMDCFNQRYFLCVFLDYFNSISFLSIPRNNMEILFNQENQLRKECRLFIVE